MEAIHRSWRFSETPTPTQVLGQTVDRQQRIGAIRFPSEACRERGIEGHNIVIFQAAMAAGDSLIIIGSAGETLQRWP